MKSVVLLSGGVDSVTCLYLAKKLGPVMAVMVDYGQANRQELPYARLLCGDLAVPYICITVCNFPGMRPDLHHCCPGRNAMLLSMAASVAEDASCDTIWVGANKDDYTNYPDCRPEFFRAFEVVISPIKVISPLIDMTKAEVLREATSLGVAVEDTHYCYVPQYGKPCGHCDACKLRTEAMTNVSG